MGKASNLILILVTILSLGIAIGVLIKNRKSENNTIDKEMTVASETKSEIINESIEESTAYDTPIDSVEPIAEYEMTAQSNPFNNSLQSQETGEYVKSILLEYFSYQASRSESGTVYKPFENKIKNLPSNIDYSKYGYTKYGYNEANQSPELREILRNSAYFSYDLIQSIVNNFQLVTCEKGVSYSAKIKYKCSFILNTLDGTGLDSEINKVPRSFEISLIQEKVGYSISAFD